MKITYKAEGEEEDETVVSGTLVAGYQQLLFTTVDVRSPELAGKTINRKEP